MSCSPALCAYSRSWTAKFANPLPARRYPWRRIRNCWAIYPGEPRAPRHYRVAAPYAGGRSPAPRRPQFHFRGFHTIKGLAGFLELWDVQQLAHETETVLDRARSSQWALTQDAFDAILESADYLRRWLMHLESTMQGQPSQQPPPNDLLIRRIRALTADSLEDGQPAVELAHMAAAVEAPPVAEASAPVAEPTRHRNETMAVKVDTAKLDTWSIWPAKW